MSATAGTMPTPRLELRDVTVRRADRTVLAADHLALPADQTTVIMGPNGAGKSTLLQVLGLLLPPSAGSVLLDGVPLRTDGQLLAARRRMASVFQAPLLFDTSVWENVASGLRLRGASAARRTAAVGHWLAALGITHLARRPAHALSGGEAQRVSLARALALDPDVLLLDEPFAALDTPTRHELLDAVESLVRRPGRAVVVVTHDRTEALRLGDRVAVLLDGRVAQVGPTAAVFGSPVTEAVAAFVGVETVLHGQVVAVRDGLVTVACGPVHLTAAADLAVGQAVLVCLRPEDVVVSLPSERTGGTSALNQLPGVVRAAHARGPLVRLEIDCGRPLSALVTRASAADLGLAPGRAVVAAVKASAIHLIVRPEAAATPRLAHPDQA